MFDPRPVVRLFLAMSLLAGCASNESTGPDPRPFPPTRPPVIAPEPGPEIFEPDLEQEPQNLSGLRPPHMQERPIVRIGLLLPFSASNTALRAEAASMLDAAELAVFESGDPRLLLIPKDTGGSTEGGRQAAVSAIRDGVDIIIGPLLSRAVSGAAGPAANRKIPLISFSTDHTIAGNGVYLLSFQPEAEVARIIDYAVANEHQTFALLRPETAYGRRVETAMRRQALANLASISDVQTYSRGTSDLNGPVSVIAHSQERQQAMDEWQLAGGIGDPALDPEFVFDLPYTAILLPEGGVRLQSLAPMLPYFDVDPRKTRFLGTAQWFDESLTREPALTGGWFSGPDLDSLTNFRNSFRQAYSMQPERLAPLSYDAVRVASAIAETGEENSIQMRLDWLQDPRGFTGASGLFRFFEDGTVEHALAVYQMRRGRFEVIDPAPSQFEPADF